MKFFKAERKIKDNKIDLISGFDKLVEYNPDYDSARIMKCADIIIEHTNEFSVNDIQYLIYSKAPIDESSSSRFKFNSQLGIYLSRACKKLVKNETDIIKLDLGSTLLNFAGNEWSSGVLELKGELGWLAGNKMSGGLIYVNGRTGRYACNEMAGGIFLSKEIESFDKDLKSGIIVSDNVLINKERRSDAVYRVKIMPYLLEKIKEESSNKKINDSVLTIPKMSIKKEEAST